MISVYLKNGKVTRIEVNQAGRVAILQEYSVLMKRLEKAEKYMNDETKPVSEREKHTVLLQILLRDISIVLFILKLIGEDWEAHKWLK